VRRRLEVLGEPRGIAVVDDFAHHPTAVRVTLKAARDRWPERRIWGVFEPRSATTRRNVFQQEFAHAFAGFDEVIIASHERLHEIAAEKRFDPERLCHDLNERGTSARFLPEVDQIVDTVAAHARKDDVVLVMSNGGFGGVHQKLLAALEGRA
jgi:UDP-N-acetylmuramate: L-alanyl-gamma-D-glutamyl-meso-diaminopimelate ligase